MEIQQLAMLRVLRALKALRSAGPASPASRPWSRLALVTPRESWTRLTEVSLATAEERRILRCSTIHVDAQFVAAD